MSASVTPIQVNWLSDKEILLGQQTNGNSNLFSDIFSNAIEDVKAKESDLQQKQYLLSTGQIDDAHTVPIAAAQAQLSIDLLVQLRNKALEGYNQLMQLQV